MNIDIVVTAAVAAAVRLESDVKVFVKAQRRGLTFV